MSSKQIVANHFIARENRMSGVLPKVEERIVRIALRRMLQSDAEKLFAIHCNREVFIADPYGKQAWPEFAKRIAGEARSHRLKSFVIEADGEVVGTARLKINIESRYRHIGSIGILLSPTVHGKGVGARVIEMLVCEAIRCGVNRIEVDHGVPVDRPELVKFFEKLEFKQEGVMRFAVYSLKSETFVDAVMLARVVRGGCG